MTAVIGITCQTLLPEPTGATDEPGEREQGEQRGDDRYAASAACAEAVARAGGTPVFLPFEVEAIASYLDDCQGFVIVGDGDPDLAPFDQANHVEARLCDGAWQAFASALLGALDEASRPVLGVDLGMRLMALHHGGALHQHLPDVLDPAAARQHLEGDHPVDCEVDSHEILPTTGSVASAHHQAVADAGRMRVVATADDGLIEAIDLEDRPFYLGVQWRAEAAVDEYLGQSLFNLLVEAAEPTDPDAAP
jgi:putative glutamine amidotransferase